MNTLKYCTVLALSGVFCVRGAWASGEDSAYRFNSSIKGAFYRAAEMKNEQQLQKLLNLGYSIDTADEFGMSALCTAKEKGNDEAYDILYKYGANDKAACMQKAVSNARSHAWAKTVKYGGLLALGGGVVGAFAMASGGGGGDGSNSGGNSSNYVPGNNGSIADGNWSEENTSSLDNNDIQNYTDADFNNNTEYNGKNFDEGVGSVNYLGAINAAEAFAKMAGGNSDGSQSKLKEVSVGVIDSGVWGNHNEFKTNGGSKVSGYNYDYGPCLNGDTSNCWNFSGNVIGGLLKMTLLDANGNEKLASAISCENGDSAQNCYNRWAAKYPVGYDWDKLQYYFYPNNYNKELDNGDSLHGTNVASIIAANKNGVGNMGVAFQNTKVVAMRWDLMSNLADPLLKMNGLKDSDGKRLVTAVNLSLGNSGTEVDASDATKDGILKQYMGAENLDAFKSMIAGYERDTAKGTIDGMIIVKSAGNSSMDNPDVWSGVKLVDDYKDLLNLVVVAVDVTLDSSNKVTDYKLSDFSNKCGVTSKFCIAAPGGYSNPRDLLYGAGTPPDGYIGMAGTSQAAPVVTGSIAFIKGAYPYMKASQIIELLTDTANKLHAQTEEDKKTFGTGLLDLGKATTYQAGVGETGVSTVAGESFNSGRLNVSAAHINVPSMMKNAVINALPKNITVFDKYNRPFDFSTQNMVSATHGGYKALKNDVYHISQRSPLKQIQKGNLNFAFSGSAANSNGSGLGFMTADYQTENYTTGFYFSENTRYDGGEYFANATSNPFMAMQNAYGVHNTFNLNKNMGLKIEAVTGRNGLYDGESSFYDASFKKQAYAMNSELQLHKGEKFGFSLTSGLLYENGAMLGMNGSGALKANDSGTYNAGVKASWYATPKLTFTGSYYRGYTEGQSFDSNLLKTSNLVSESFALDANYKMNKQTSFGFNLSSPLRVVDGKLSVNFPNGRDNYSETVYFNRYSAALKPEAREYKFALYANHDVSERLSLRSELDVRVNPEHQRQENDYRALFGLNWNFN